MPTSKRTKRTVVVKKQRKTSQKVNVTVKIDQSKKTKIARAKPPVAPPQPTVIYAQAAPQQVTSPFNDLQGILPLLRGAFMRQEPEWTNEPKLPSTAPQNIEAVTRPVGDGMHAPSIPVLNQHAIKQEKETRLESLKKFIKQEPQSDSSLGLPSPSTKTRNLLRELEAKVSKPYYGTSSPSESWLAQRKLMFDSDSDKSFVSAKDPVKTFDKSKLTQEAQTQYQKPKKRYYTQKQAIEFLQAQGIEPEAMSVRAMAKQINEKGLAQAYQEFPFTANRKER